MKKPITDTQDQFPDFGFSTFDFDPEESKIIKSKSDEKARRIYDCIVPLLDNLSSNPTQSSIHWPNRVEKIQEFKKKLLTILEED